MPYKSLEGFQVLPNRKFKTPILVIAGIPFAKRKTQIRRTAIMDVLAERRKIFFMIHSLVFAIIVPLQRKQAVENRQPV